MSIIPVPPAARAAGAGRSRVWMRAAITLLVLSGLLWWLSTDQLLAAMQRVAPFTWALVVAGFITGHVAAAFKWRLLLSATQVFPGVTETLRAHGAGLFANLCLPSIVGGDVVRAGMIMHRHTRYEHVALASLADRINDTLALLLLAALGALLIPQPLNPTAGHALQLVALLLFGAIITVVIMIRVVPVARLPVRLSGVFARLRTGLDLMLAAPGRALLAFLMSVLIQGGFVWLNARIALDMGIGAPLVLWLFAWPMAKLIALVPVSLGGIGVREMALAGLMAPFGIAAAQAVAQSLCWELVLIGAGLLSGLLVALYPVTAAQQETRA